MAAEIGFNFDFKAAPGARRREPEDPFKVLVLADLSGRGSRSTPPAKTLLRRVDLDNFDALFEQLAPVIEVELAPGVPLQMEFTDYDDLHADALFDKQPLFQSFRELRARLANNATFAAAAAEMGYEPAAPGESAKSNDGAAEPDTDLNRLLGSRAAHSTEPVSGGAVENLIRNVLEPYIVADPDPQQQTWLASIDASIAEQMRALLHSAAFQQLEAAWTGLRKLVMESECGEELSVYVVDISRAELSAQLQAEDPTASSLFETVVHQHTQVAGGNPFSLLVADFSFGHSALDLAELSVLGALSHCAGGPVLAAAAPALLGLAAGLDGKALISQWGEAEADIDKAWRALRATPQAASIGLTFPGILIRLPYGNKTEPTSGFDFEELGDERRHREYLWGHAPLALASVFCDAFSQAGWRMSSADVRAIESLPVHSFEDAAGTVQMQACAETFMTESAASELLSRGLVPVVSVKNRDAANLPRLQSIATPAQALAAAWS